MPAGLDLALYQDKMYSPTTAVIDRRQSANIGFVSIPIDVMRLGESALDLIARLAEDAQSLLPEKIDEIEERPIGDDVNAQKTFGSVFGNFPLALKVMALEQGSYFATRWDTANTFVDAERAVILGARIISTPIGGLPPWAKDYVRRHRVG
ncbi:MAG: hypothetical protein ABIE84_06430 [bacterium]